MSAAQPSVRSEVTFCSLSPTMPVDNLRRRPNPWLRSPIAILGHRGRLFARICFSMAILALLMSVCTPARAQQVIDTLAGGFNNSASPSENACAPVWSAAPSGTNVYVTSCDQIFEVNAAGQWTHVAGNGITGFSPDGTPAAGASLGLPDKLSVDSSGNIYFNETFNNRIREIVVATGKLLTVAGTGVSGYSGDGSLAINAEIAGGSSDAIFVDGHGNVFIGDGANHRVREVVAATGIINTVAGNGTAGSSGDGGPATAAELRGPRGVYVDGSGNIFIADHNNNNIREVVAATGDIQTVAGNGTAGFSGDTGPATSAELDFPVGVFLDSSGDILIADLFNNRIREVVGGPGGNIKTVAGNGGGFPISCTGAINACLGVGGPATNALVPSPTEIVLDSAGDMFIPIVLDTRNVIEEVVAATGNLEIFAANGAQNFAFGRAHGQATQAQLNTPSFAATDGSGNVFISDATNNVIYEVVAASGVINIVAGNGSAGYSGDGGAAIFAELSSPNSVFVDSSGNLLIADSINNVIREVVAATGVIETVAGSVNPSCTYSGDGGPATSAGLCYPVAVVEDSHGNIFISDSNDNVIREVTAATGIINTVAGNFILGGAYTGDGGPATSASLNGPVGVFVDGSENIFIVDQSNNVVREVVAATGNIRTVAGNGTQGFSGDGSPATSAEFYNPSYVWGDASGNFYVSDGNGVIRKFTVGGNIQTVAGDRVQGTAGDGGPATSAELDSPFGVFVEPSGSLLITDLNDGRVRIVGAATTTTLTSSSNPAFADQDVTLTVTVTPTGGGTPIGSVNFLDGGTVFGEEPVNASGQATTTISALAIGAHTLTAQYFGTNFPGSTSSSLDQEIDAITGNLTISAGQTYTFNNTSIPGNLVMNGGTVVLNNTTIGGSLTMSGGTLTVTNSTVEGTLQITGGTFSIDPSLIKGNLLIYNTRVGSAHNQICGTKVNGNLQFQFNGAAVMIGSPSCAGNTVGGELLVSGNIAATEIYGNTVRGNLQVLSNVATSQVDNNTVSGNLQVSYNLAATQVNGNSTRGNLQVSNNIAATQVDNNKVSENLLIQNNIASTGVFSNTVEDKLECSGNNASLITGGGNKAEQKQGQCAKF